MWKKFKSEEKFFVVLGFFLAVLFFMRASTAMTEVRGGVNDGSQVEMLSKVAQNIMENPLAINFSYDSTIRWGLIGAGVYVVVIIYMFGSKKNLMTGKEHGSAKWADRGDSLSIADPDPQKNILFTLTEKMSLDTRKTRKNLNVLVIGGSGSGKTRFFVKPNIMQHNTSYVITDPKGELLKSTAKLLESEGFKIKVFNLIDMNHSNAYNPFEYLREDKDVLTMISLLIKNTTPVGQRSQDPFWEKAETALLQAICYYLYYEAPDEEQNFSMVMELLRAAEVRETDEAYESDLDLLFNYLKDKDPNHIALKQYAIFKQAAGQTAKSILVSVGVRLAAFNQRNIGALTITDNLDLQDLGTEKTVLFVVVPDSHDTFNFLVAMMYSQIFDSLYFRADNEFGGRLPVHVRFLLDEFANIGQIPDFEKKVATMRSREISVSIIIQNLAQLKTNYKESWESITGNCDSLLFLGGQEQTTLEYISKRLGKQTIEIKTTGQSKGKSSSNSINFGKHGRELMQPDEISQMPDKQCILLIRGMKPFYSQKIVIENLKNYDRLDDTNEGSNFSYEKIHTPFDKLDSFFRNGSTA